MALDNAAHIGQADAGAIEIFHAVQALEHAKQLVGVFHVEADAIVGHVEHGLARQLLAADADHRRIALAGELDRVRQQIIQGQLEERRIGGDLRQRRDDPVDAVRRQVRRQLVDDAAHQVVHAHADRPQRRPSHLREAQQVVDQLARQPRRVLDVGQEALAPLRVVAAGRFHQQVGEADDVAQRRAQVVRHRIRERLQFLVGAAQLLGQVGHLLGALQRDAQQRGAEFDRQLDLAVAPRRAGAVHRLAPQLETGARRQHAIAGLLAVRAPGPVDLHHVLGPEPQQVVRVDARDLHRQQAAGA
ncbi:conserved hypothetical protein, partial [Ricinus communis]